MSVGSSGDIAECRFTGQMIDGYDNNNDDWDEQTALVQGQLKIRPAIEAVRYIGVGIYWMRTETIYEAGNGKATQSEVGMERVRIDGKLNNTEGEVQ
ncbi:hypothetical protein BY996DRAFT_6446233 [Phakopsora pachyrhizi]|nr:hypothetical protein BY996DRAFT_6446233 [Phakopsora pachyrhizi]